VFQGDSALKPFFNYYAMYWSYIGCKAKFRPNLSWKKGILSKALIYSFIFCIVYCTTKNQNLTVFAFVLDCTLFCPLFLIVGLGSVLYLKKGAHVYHRKVDRALTNRDRARLQTFPDTLIFEGSKVSVRRQIGMAVPPEGARVIFEAIIKTLEQIEYSSVEPDIELGNF